MSFKPTVSVFVDGKLVNWIIMRNGFGSSLLVEASFFAARVEAARSPEQAAELLGAEYPPIDELEEFKDYPTLGDITEYPLLVDVSRRAIYVAAYPCSDEEFARLESIEDSTDLVRLFHNELPLEDGEVVPFSALDFDAIRMQPEYEEFVEWTRERGQSAG